MKGGCHAHNVGASLLNTVGLADEWVVEGEDAYVQCAVRAAANIPHLAALRAGMRQRVLNSRLCDGPGFVRDLESVYTRLFERWWEQQQQQQTGTGTTTTTAAAAAAAPSSMAQGSDSGTAGERTELAAAAAAAAADCPLKQAGDDGEGSSGGSISRLGSSSNVNGGGSGGGGVSSSSSSGSEQDVLVQRHDQDQDGASDRPHVVNQPHRQGIKRASE